MTYINNLVNIFSDKTFIWQTSMLKFKCRSQSTLRLVMIKIIRLTTRIKVVKGRGNSSENHEVMFIFQMSDIERDKTQYVQNKKI